VEAVDEYRSTLRSVDEHSDEVRTDPLQLLHIVHNLEDILSLKPTGVGHTLNDSQLKPQVIFIVYYSNDAQTYVQTYSLTNVGPGADHGIQAVSLQVTFQVTPTMVGFHYFSPGLWSPSQPKNITVL